MKNATPALILVLVLLAALWAVAAGRGSGGDAACAAVASDLEASPAQAAPGELFRLHGEGFYGDFVCDDQGIALFSRPAGGRPTDGIRVEFLQGTKTWTLATVSSGEDLTFDAVGLHVPAGASPGEAIVRATSPSTAAGTSPLRSHTPFLVLDAPSDTGSPKDHP